MCISILVFSLILCVIISGTVPVTWKTCYSYPCIDGDNSI